MSETAGTRATFRHAGLSGTPYEIGSQEAMNIRQRRPEEAAFWFGEKSEVSVSPATVREAIEIFEQHCPWINEELRGFADGFGQPPEKVIQYALSYVPRGHCSHFALLPAKTGDVHMLAGRSYEWNEDDEMRLVTTYMEGCHAHLGFSLFLFGRYDGLNEKGLTVTMSSGIPIEQSSVTGLRFWAVVRILLDTCADVEEALARLRTLPISGYFNLVLADRGGRAALVEIHDDIQAIRRIGPGDPDGFVASANHYRLPDMQPLVRNRMRQSVDRYAAIERTLQPERVEREALLRLLSTHTPDGMACHYYADGLGTLWSCLYDLTAGSVDICFGSPLANPWRTFGLNRKEGETDYAALLPGRESTSEMWERV